MKDPSVAIRRSSANTWAKGGMGAPAAGAIREPLVAELRARAVARARAEIKALPHDDVEDLAQQVVLDYLRYSNVVGVVREPEHLGNVIITRRIRDRIARLRCERRHDVLDEGHEEFSDRARRDTSDSLDDGVFLVERVRLFLRERQPKCEPLCDAVMAGENFLQLAARTGLSHAAVRKRWSRCAEFVRAAVRSGELQVDGLIERLRRDR